MTIDATSREATIPGVLTFTGTYAPVSIPSEGDNTMLYLGSANKLYYPTKAMTIGTHRAYFQLAEGITAGNSAGGNEHGDDVEYLVRAFVLNFGDDGNAGDPARIHVIDAGEGTRAPHAWYTLDGRRLDGVPTAKGLYINKGKKVVVK